MKIIRVHSPSIEMIILRFTLNTKENKKRITRRLCDDTY